MCIVYIGRWQAKDEPLSIRQQFEVHANIHSRTHIQGRYSAWKKNTRTKLKKTRYTCRYFSCSVVESFVILRAPILIAPEQHCDWARAEYFLYICSQAHSTCWRRQSIIVSFVIDCGGGNNGLFARYKIKLREISVQLDNGYDRMVPLVKYVSKYDRPVAFCWLLLSDIINGSDAYLHYNLNLSS